MPVCPLTLLLAGVMILQPAVTAIADVELTKEHQASCTQTGLKYHKCRYCDSRSDVVETAGTCEVCGAQDIRVMENSVWES